MVNIRPIVSLLLAACVSIGAGFICFDVSTLESGVQHLGLYVLLVLMVAWCYWGIQVLFTEASVNRRAQLHKWWLGAGRLDVLFVCLVSLCVHLQQPHEYKVLMDEISLLNVSRAIYETQQTYSPGEFDFVFDDYVLSEDGYIGKRPYGFPFAVSVLHFLTGYRYTNGFLLNSLITPILLGLIVACVRAHVSRPLVSYAAVLLFASFPVVAQMATSSGAEWLNTTLVVLLAYAGILFVRRPCLERMQFMFATACVLAYARYESIAYVLAAGAIWAVVCWRERRMILSYGVALYPFALIPLVWIMRIVGSNESDYFQHETLGTDVTFSTQYAIQNLQDFGRFLFEMQPLSLNAPVTAALLLIVSLVCLARALSSRGVSLSTALMSPLLWLALVACACQGLLLFYLWGNLNDPVVTRIASPFLVLWVIIAVVCWGRLFSARVKATPVCCALLVCLWFGQFSKGEALAARSNLPVVRSTLAGEWIREEMGLRDVLFSWNVQLFLPYRVTVFPEINLYSEFDALAVMQAKGLMNRVFIYYEPDHPRSKWGDRRLHVPFLERGGQIRLVRSQFVGPGREMRLYELDFEGYQRVAAE